MAPQKGSKRTEAPAFDFTKLTPTEAPAPRVTRGVAAVDNPALSWVRDSWNGKKAVAKTSGEQGFLGAGRQVFVPTVNAKQTESLLRRAAAQLSAELHERIGVAIRSEDDPKDPSDTTGRKVLRGQTRVSFAAQSAKKAYTKKKGAQEQDNAGQQTSN